MGGIKQNVMRENAEYRFYDFSDISLLPPNLFGTGMPCVYQTLSRLASGRCALSLE